MIYFHKSHLVSASNIIKRILILDYLHVYNDQRMLLQAEALVAEGFNVCVIGTARFGKHEFRETRTGIDFYLLPLVATYNPFLIILACWRWLCGDPRNVIPLPDESPRRGNIVAILFYCLWALRLGMQSKADSITVHEHIPLPIGWVIARLHRIPLVYDEHDYVGAIGYYEGFRGRIAAAIEAFFLRRVDAATTVGERLATVLRDYGTRRVVVVGNWKRLDDYNIPIEEITRARSQLRIEHARLVVSYLSIFGPARYIPELIEAVRQTPEVILLIGGSGWEMYEKLIQEAAASSPNIRYLGWVERSKIPLYSLMSDVIYHCLDATDNPQMSYAAPNKLFESFAAGKPLLAKLGTGEMSDILQHEDAGLLLDEVTSDNLRQAFHQLMDTEFRQRISVNALNAAKRYNWDEICRRLVHLYREILPDA